MLVTGDETHDGTYGLTAEQQVRYADLTEVAAIPVSNAVGTTIAVLSVSSTASMPMLATGFALDAIETAALAVARILVDLLHWALDS